MSKWTNSALGETIRLIVTFAASGLFCEYGFDNIWGSIFYITGKYAIRWQIKITIIGLYFNVINHHFKSR